VILAGSRVEDAEKAGQVINLASGRQIGVN